MPKWSDNPRSLRQHRSKLLCVAEGVLSQATRNADVNLSWAELATAQQAAEELSEWPRGQPAPATQLKLASGAHGQATAAYVALFALALRRSSPFATGGGMQQLYASLRQHLCRGLRCAMVDGEVGGGPFCAEVLAPALLRTDTLECYSRLLTEAAEQLQPDAVAALPGTAANACTTAAGLGVEASYGVESATAGKQQAEPAGSARKPRPGQPTLLTTLRVISELREVLQICRVGMHHLYLQQHEQQQQQEQRSLPDASDSDSSQAGSAPPQQPADDLPSAIRNQLQSSWVLEHWARVLLLGTVPALASGVIEEQGRAQAMQADMLHSLSYVLCFEWTDFVRRPWGCALAATHMAHLCAALDGGHAFGWPRPDVVVLPGAELHTEDSAHYADWCDGAAAASDATATAAGRAGSLLPALDILRAWISVLESELEDGPRPAGEGADVGKPRAGGEAPRGATKVQAASEQAATAAAAVAQQGGLAAGKAGPPPAVQRACRETDGARAGPAGGGSHIALIPPADSPGSGLPPLNRPATVALCLRLAKGVLARWGGELRGVHVFNGSGGWGSAVPLLPKVAGCSVLYHSLACARLALLPDVWGRERVPRRTRAQLREWWETYVAAAQHPEALAVAAFHPIDPQFGWTEVCRGAPRPSADASAALAAGLLPCMTRLAARIGAARDDDTVWDSRAPFAGLGPCWAEVLLHGPLGQVAELVSAGGRRLRVVVGELRGAAEAARGAGGGRSVGRAADAAVATLGHALYLGFCTWAGGLEAPPRPDANAALRFSWAAAELLPAVSLALLLCSKVCNGESSAVGLGRRTGAMEGSRAQRRAAGARLFEVLWSSGRIFFLIAPLLAKHIWEAAAEMEQASGAGGGSGCSSSGSGDSSSGGSSSCSTARSGNGSSGDSSSCSTARSGSGSSGGSSGSICGYSCGSSGGSSSHGGCSCKCGDGGGSSTTTSSGGQGGAARSGAAADSGTPWRQLLLRKVRLMELLGAAAELHSEETVSMLFKCGDAKQEWVDESRPVVAHALALSAAAFPAEFRAAVGGAGAAAGTGTGTGTGTGAGPGAGEGPRVAVGGARGAAGAGAMMSAEADARAGLGTGTVRGPSGTVRSTGARSTARPCISMAAVHEALGTGAFGEQLGVVDRVLGGRDPTPGEVWDLVCSCCPDSCGLRREQLEVLMPLLMPPAEARAVLAVAAAAAAASPAS